MATEILVEFSKNGILGRVIGPDLIVYPGVFLGLPFDVYMPRGSAVYGPDVDFDTQFVTTSGSVRDTMKATLPEITPGDADSTRDRAFPRLGIESPPAPHISQSAKTIIWTDNKGKYARSFTPACMSSVCTDPATAEELLAGSL